MKTLRIGLQIALVLAIASASAISHLVAQSEGPATPTALIITYRAKPGERLHFLASMRNEGYSQFVKWKDQGVYSDFQLFQPAYAGAAMNTPDLFAILRFSHFTDLAAWQKVERDLPGGLPLDAQSIAWAETSNAADVVAERSGSPSTRDSQFFILTYDVLIPEPEYREYTRGYVLPQFEQWIKAGVLNSYTVFTNQNPAGAPWGSFILLEYKDIEALGRREVVKNQAREELAQSDPEWKKWSEDKTKVRTEQAAMPVLPLR